MIQDIDTASLSKMEVLLCNRNIARIMEQKYMMEAKDIQNYTKDHHHNRQAHDNLYREPNSLKKKYKLQMPELQER